MLLFVFSSAILGVAVFLTARGSLQQQLTASVQSDAAFLQAEYQRGGLAHLEALIAARQREPDAPDYLLQGPAGQHLAGEIEMTGRLSPGWTVLQTQEAGLDLERPERLRTLVVDLGGGLRLAVGDDLARIGEVEEAIASAFAWVVGLAVVLGIGGGVLLSRAFLARVDTIARTAEAIIAGDLGRRIPMHGDDDFDRLSATLNHMLDRISGLMETLRQVSSDIAHDLRTPLSRLYQKLESIREGSVTHQGQMEAVEA
ncbi:HAMP domain-containing protein, partial [Acidisoma sp. 7E03]